MTTICPQCSLKQNDSVPVCDCGYDLADYRKRQQALQRARRAEQAPVNRLELWRIALWAGSALCVLTGCVAAVMAFWESGSLWVPMVAVMVGLLAAVLFAAGAEALGYLLRLGAQSDHMTVLLRQLRDEDERNKPA